MRPCGEHCLVPCIVVGQMSQEVVGGQHADGAGRGGGATLGLHPQDLAVIGMGSARDLVDMASLVRSTSTRDDPAHVRDVIHRPRDLQRALDALGPLGTATRTDVSGGCAVCAALILIFLLLSSRSWCCRHTPTLPLESSYSAPLNYLVVSEG